MAVNSPGSRQRNALIKLNPASMAVLVFLICCSLISIFSIECRAAQVTLAWDPNSESDLAGYVAYWGTSSRNYTHSTDVGNRTSLAITGLEEGRVYYFAVTAYDSDSPRNVSTYSAELVYAVPRVDTDGDGLSDADETGTYGTDPSNPDTDGDGLPDGWEVSQGTNPRVADANGDIDGDGLTNLEEYQGWQQTGNYLPNRPVLAQPSNAANNVSLSPVLRTSSFSDPDVRDYHLQTRWQISGNADFSDLVFDLQSGTYLTQLTIPDSLLDTGRRYWWRARFYDNHSGASAWSTAFTFNTVAVLSDDRDGNGIPDGQEVGFSVDLDENGIPDQQQGDMLCAQAVSGDVVLGIKSPAADVFIENFKSLESSPNTILAATAPQFPMGLISFKLAVSNPGDRASIVIYFSKPISGDGMDWYKYTPADGWHSYAAHATFSADYKSVTLEFEDGGFGDADGVRNGMIVDPSGLGLLTPGTSSSASGGGGGGGGGCFIGTASNGTHDDIANPMSGFVDAYHRFVKKPAVTLFNRIFGQ